MSLSKVLVSTADTELEFTIKSKTRGQALFDQVVQTIGIREVWFFGLEHKTSTGGLRWLDLTKRISKQDVKREAVLKFDFKVKYFPEDIDEILQEKTLKLFYQQAKKDILAERLFCSSDKCVLLASYVAQVKFGDHDDNKNEGYLANENLLPSGVIAKHSLSREEWETKVESFHKNHLGLTKEEAMMEYLKLIQDLEMYGTSYYPVVNKRGTSVLMGIDSRGINIYNKEDKLNPTISFPWSEVQKVKPSKTSLKITLVAKETPPFVVKTTDAKLINDLALGNHNLFVRRRDPKETLEVQQMKNEREEKRRREKDQNEMLKKQISERVKSQAACKDFEEKFIAMQSKMTEYQTQLTEAQARIAELEAQLKETKETREALEAQQNELKEMLEILEKDKELGAVQKQELMEEIEKKQTEIEETKALVDVKEEEAESLRREMEAANEEIKNANHKMQEVIMSPPPEFSTPPIVNGRSSPTHSLTSAVESNLGDDAPIPSIVISAEDLEKLEVRDREPDTKLFDLTKELREELQEARDPDVPLDTLERIDRDNMAKGRDKFKTLREIRSGFAKRRIDTFENM